eukprot:1158006-Pelagomonas_calceolata.AAC.20
MDTWTMHGGSENEDKALHINEIKMRLDRFVDMHLTETMMADMANLMRASQTQVAEARIASVKRKGRKDRPVWKRCRSVMLSIRRNASACNASTCFHFHLCLPLHTLWEAYARRLQGLEAEVQQCELVKQEGFLRLQCIHMLSLSSVHTLREAYARRLQGLEAEVQRCEAVCHEAASGAEQLFKVSATEC